MRLKRAKLIITLSISFQLQRELANRAMLSLLFLFSSTISPSFCGLARQIECDLASFIKEISDYNSVATGGEFRLNLSIPIQTCEMTFHWNNNSFYLDSKSTAGGPLCKTKEFTIEGVKTIDDSPMPTHIYYFCASDQFCVREYPGHCGNIAEMHFILIFFGIIALLFICCVFRCVWKAINHKRRPAISSIQYQMDTTRRPDPVIVGEKAQALLPSCKKKGKRTILSCFWPKKQSPFPLASIPSDLIKAIVSQMTPQAKNTFACCNTSTYHLWHLTTPKIKVYRISIKCNYPYVFLLIEREKGIPYNKTQIVITLSDLPRIQTWFEYEILKINGDIKYSSDVRKRWVRYHAEERDRIESKGKLGNLHMRNIAWFMNATHK